MKNRYFRMKLAVCAATALLLGGHAAARAEPTNIVIRVMAKDAKFIGTETGGVQVTLRDADTGELLAQGMTAGATGNTPKIMTNGHARRDPLSDELSAKFSAVLDIRKPVRIVATVNDSKLSKNAALTVSSTQWVLPGKAVGGGDGWVLELPGFAITPLEPVPESVALEGGEAKLSLKFKVTMQCGCPITPGGIWDADKFQIAAMLEDRTGLQPAMPLSYAGQPSTFTGNLVLHAAGRYVIDVYAYDPSTGNTGLAKYPIRVR